MFSAPFRTLLLSLLSQVVINCSVLPALQMKLNSPHESLRKEACWALSNITAGNRVQIQVCASREKVERERERREGERKREIERGGRECYTSTVLAYIYKCAQSVTASCGPRAH